MPADVGVARDIEVMIASELMEDELQPRKTGKLGETANAGAFLSSNQASLVTGRALEVD